VIHWLNRQLTVWRATLTADGQGGYTRAWSSMATVAAKVDLSTAAEQEVAARWEARHTHNIFLLPDAAVQRGDRLADPDVDVDDPQPGDVWYQVISTHSPSTPRYLKAAAELV